MRDITKRPYGVSQAIWDGWQAWRHTYKTLLLTGRETFDPNKHLPKVFQEKLVHVPYTEKHRITDLEAVEDGRAAIDDRGYISFNYEKQLSHDKVEITKKIHVVDPLDAMIAQADARERGVTMI